MEIKFSRTLIKEYKRNFDFEKLTSKWIQDSAYKNTKSGINKSTFKNLFFTGFKKLEWRFSKDAYLKNIKLDLKSMQEKDIVELGREIKKYRHLKLLIFTNVEKLLICTVIYICKGIEKDWRIIIKYIGRLEFTEKFKINSIIKEIEKEKSKRLSIIEQDF